MSKQTSKHIKQTTFKDLYEFLQDREDPDIISWLKKKEWAGKEKLESLLRLFAGLGLMSKINNKYNIYKGNFNKNQQVIKHESLKDVFYNDKGELIKLNDKGDSSDLTCKSKENDKHFLLTTSKNKNKLLIGDLDLTKIAFFFRKYENMGYTMSFCICIRNKKDFMSMVNRSELSSHELKELIKKKCTIIIDFDDINEAYHHFKHNFGGKSMDKITKLNNTSLCLRMHQRLGVMKTLKLKDNGEMKILWGHVQRSGKSYIIAGCIIADGANKDKCNYLIITTAPNETIDQQRIVFCCNQLEGYNIVVLNGKNKKPVLTKKNIILCSKQFLQNKIGEKNTKITKTDRLRTIKKYLRSNDIKPQRTYTQDEIDGFIHLYSITKDEILTDKSSIKPQSIKWLNKIKFDMRFLDESHNGGTTPLAQKTLDYYGKNSFTMQITATYSKPANDYNIHVNNWVLWDMEDIKLCKNIKTKGNVDRLVQKHGEEIRTILKGYSDENIMSVYSNYADLHILTDEITPEILPEILRDTRHTCHGWSTEACFLLKQGVKDKKVISIPEFQKEGETLKLWYKIFGKQGKFGIPDKEYPDSKVFMKRIEKICKNPTIDSRFIGEGGFSNEPMIILAFLPVFTDRGTGYLSKISNATINLLEKHNVIPDYDIITINEDGKGKTTIEDARIKARINGKKGVLVLSGTKCGLGVSINNCDIVLLLNNNTSFDMIYQMMFRCMTEGKGKKCGFVVDLNIHRVIETSVITYASSIKPDLHPREGAKYILQERLLNLNCDHWMPTFGHDGSKITTLCENMYELYSSNTEKALNQCLNRLRFKEVLLTQDEQNVFDIMFSVIKPTKQQLKIINDCMNGEEKIKKGIERVNVSDETKSDETKSDETKKINYMDILKHIIPLVCLLTIHHNDTSLVEMFQCMESDKYIYSILLDQTKSWWGKNIDTRIIKKFIDVYVKYMKNDKETIQIIRTVKELFMKNINNNNELSKLIDKYLIPQELEKKSNAEVSTPFKLRKEMMDKIPVEFWSSVKKVFEPCSGKGGFVVDIVARFMLGLSGVIPDEIVRYKTIMEECLYFCDINPTNIFICKLLIDPYNDYDLNFHEGNTLDLDIHEKWDIDGFDAVIGNPPYNASGNTGTGNTIWQYFTKKALDTWVKPRGLLMFVHPPGWRKPNTKRGKFYGLYESMTKNNQMLWLSIHGIKDGQSTFKCGTRYDWYLLEKIPVHKNTVVKDEKGVLLNVDMSEFKWLPNYNISMIQRLLAKEGEGKCEIIYSPSAYEHRKKWMSKTKDDVFQYTCVHSTPKKGVRYMYSKLNDRGHFDVPKVIFGESGINDVIIDMNGDYGLTNGCIAIKICDVKNGEKYKNFLESKEMCDIVLSCSFSSFRVDWNIFKDMKRDFWMENISVP